MLMEMLSECIFLYRYLPIEEKNSPLCVFHEKECQGVDVATHRFSRDVALSSALFVWAAGARCMLVSVFGAAISVTNSSEEASALLLIHSTDRSRRTGHGKTLYNKENKQIN